MLDSDHLLTPVLVTSSSRRYKASRSRCMTTAPRPVPSTMWMTWWRNLSKSWGHGNAWGPDNLGNTDDFIMEKVKALTGSQLSACQPSYTVRHWVQCCHEFHPRGRWLWPLGSDGYASLPRLRFHRGTNLVSHTPEVRCLGRPGGRRHPCYHCCINQRANE